MIKTNRVMPRRRESPLEFMPTHFEARNAQDRSHQYRTGGGGNERVIGPAAADRLFGGAPVDALNGAAGNDRLFGGAGSDTLLGGGGDDTLCAGRRRFVRRLAGISFGAAIAIGTRCANALMPPAPPPLTIEEKVAAADFVFVGEATELYYVDNNGQRLAQDPAESRRSAGVLSITVSDWLYPSNRPFGHIDVILSLDFSSAEELRKGYVNTPLIYFIKRMRGRRRVSEWEIVDYEYHLFAFIGGRIARIEPISYREDVMKAIRELKSSGPTPKR